MIADILHRVAGMEYIHRPYHPRPSSAGPERCIRQMVFHAMGVEPDITPGGRMQIVFDDGHWHEELTNDWIRKTSFQLHSEQMPVDVTELDFLPRDLPPRHCSMCDADVPFNMLHGHIDGIVTNTLEEDPNDVLFDHKAINHFTYQRYADGELPLDYFAQLALYSNAIQRNINSNCTDILLLVKNKNTGQYLEFVMNYNIYSDSITITKIILSDGSFIQVDKEINNIVYNAIDKFRQVHIQSEAKTLPKRQYYVDHWRCDYCLWKERCWDGVVLEQKRRIRTIPKYINYHYLDCQEARAAAKRKDVAVDAIRTYMRKYDLLFLKTEDGLIRRTVGVNGRDTIRFPRITKGKSQ